MKSCMKKHTFGFVLIQKKSFEDEFILHINFLDENLILKTPDEQNINDNFNSMPFNIFGYFRSFAHILIHLKTAHPLKTITKEIENFSNGNLSSRINMTSNDEIGTLAQTFNTMASTLEELIKTREELLRDIGHELRTPLPKANLP